MAVRLLVFDNTEAFIGEVSDIRSLTRVEEINGEHSLTFTTPMELAKQNRVLYRDSQDAWHEYVITGVEQTHDEDVQAVGTYYCVWSLQYDLEGTIVKTQPGKVNPVTSTVALTHALAGTARWTVGSVTQNTTGGASMYYLSGWEALGQVVEVWGGEVSVTITVDDGGTILSRQVNLLNHLGSAESVRRFDYSADMQSIKRTVEDAPFTCRITPRGSAVESENGGYGRKVDITSVNGGVEYLEDPDVVDIVKLPDGNGGWEYPNQVVEFDGIEDPQTLYDAALAHLHDFTRPRVSYEAEVVQLAAAGMNPHGIALGDAVDVVDKAFTPAGLRLTGRVTRAEWDDLDPANNAITIGFNPDGFAGQFQSLQADIRAINDWRDTLTTEEYIEGIIDRLNDAVNATGGYTYLVPGIGMVTYDVAVTDPAVGAEASAAVEIRGGTIRIADSKDAQGNWEWRTVFTAGHIAGELVTAAEIVTGYIGSAGGTYIDLDNNVVHLGGEGISNIDLQDDSMTVTNPDGETVMKVLASGIQATTRVEVAAASGGFRYTTDPTSYSSSIDVSGATPGSAISWSVPGEFRLGVQAFLSNITSTFSGYTERTGTITPCRYDLYHPVSGTFTAGTSATLSWSISGTYTLSGTTYNVTATYSIDYDAAAGTVTATATLSGANTSDYIIRWYSPHVVFNGSMDAPSFLLGTTDATLGGFATAVGADVEASGDYSFAEGNGSTASGIYSIAMGHEAEATANSAFALGYHANANGASSTALGGGTLADSPYQLAFGRFNESDPNSEYLFILGNGTADNARSNALTVDWSGNIAAAGNASIGGTLHQLGGTDMGQYLDLHTTDVQSGEFTQDYVVRLRPSNTGGDLGIWLNEVGTTNVVHYLLNNGTGRLLYRTSSDGGTTWSSQKGVRSPWTSLGSFTGSNYLTIDLTNYDELMVVAKFSSKVFAANLPKAALTTSNQEWWLGGGKDETTTSPANGAGRALVNVTTTRVTGVAANNGSFSVLGSTTFTVYAR